MKTGLRLNKYLADCGLGSRRSCESLITTGQVSINGAVCNNLATYVNEGDAVMVNGKRAHREATSTAIFYKPRGYVCSRKDELGRETIYSILPQTLHTLDYVGRLDMDSEGLLLLTNDGELLRKITHPTSQIEKEYHVTCNQAVEYEHLNHLIKGVYVDGEKYVAAEASKLSARKIKIVLTTGKKRQIRFMLLKIGYRVKKLVRVRIGELWLGDLQPGDVAELTTEEVGLLFNKTKKISKRGDQREQRGSQHAVKSKVRNRPWNKNKHTTSR